MSHPDPTRTYEDEREEMSPAEHWSEIQRLAETIKTLSDELLKDAQSLNKQPFFIDFMADNI